jgi:hypothetical protein
MIEQIDFHFNLVNPKKVDTYIACPHPSGISPYYKAINADIGRWLHYTGICAEATPEYLAFIRADISRVVAQTYRQCSKEWLHYINQFMHYFFAHENIIDETIAKGRFSKKHLDDIILLNKQHIQIWQNDTRRLLPQKVALGNALSNIASRLHIFDKARFRFFIDSMQDYYTGTIKQIKIASTRALISSEDIFMSVRRNTSGVDQCIELALAIENIQLTPTQRKHLLEPLKAYTSHIVMLCNDIASYRKEKLESQKDRLGYFNQNDNFLLYKQATCHISKAQAYPLTLKKINDAIVLFEKTKQRFPETHNTARACTVMENWIRGSIDWSLVTKRYNLETPLRRFKVYLQHLLQAA